MQKLKLMEISLLFGVLFALIWGCGTAYAQEELASSLIRLHVIANSDSEEDQKNKLAVRDAILTLAESWGKEAETVQEMEQIIRSNLGELEAAGEDALRAVNCFDKVTASVTDCYFPTKEYEGFALPAGRYTALRLEIGAAKGQNWWCVAFPPLCVGAGAESLDHAVNAGYFSSEDVKFLTGEGGTYILKFRSMELLGQIKAYFCGS